MEWISKLLKQHKVTMEYQQAFFNVKICLGKDWWGDFMTDTISLSRTCQL